MPKKVNILIFVLLAAFCSALFIGCSEQTAESSGEATEPDITSQLSVVSEQSTQPEQSHASSSVSQTEHSAGLIPNPEFGHFFGLEESYDGPQHPAETLPSVGEQQALFNRLMSNFIQIWNSGNIEFTNQGDQDGAISVMFGYYENPDDDAPVFTNILTAVIPAGESFTFVDEYESVYGEALKCKIVAVRYGDEYAEDDGFIAW